MKTPNPPKDSKSTFTARDAQVLLMYLRGDIDALKRMIADIRSKHTN